MNRISTNTTSNVRLTGLSGFDTETMISQLMQAEKAPLDSVYQKRMLVEWKRDAYRSVTNSLRGFKSSFFDIVNRSSYMLSSNSIKTMTAKSNNTSYLDVSAGANANVGSMNVKVLQVATADTSVTQGRLSKDIVGTVSDFALSGKTINVTLDGVTKTITLEDYTSGESSDIAMKLKASLEAAFGAGKFAVNFTSADNKLTIGTAGGATNILIHGSISAEGGLAKLGIAPGSSNRIFTNQTLAQIKDSLNIPMTFSAGGTVDFTINGKLVSADATETLASVFDKINNDPEINATIKYDFLTDKVSIASKQLGDGNNLTLDDINGNFLSAMGIDLADPIKPENQGKDAKILLNGTQELVRSTNSFTVDGVTINIKDAHPVDSSGDTITVSQDVETAFNNIKSFIDKYNELLDLLNGKINEKYDRNYLPLTDEQKEAMNDDDVKKWEEKAKTGLLRNDSIIQKIVQDMRTALYEKVEGVGISLKDIGIESKSYIDRGKLYIDENKLKDALQNKPDEVAKLLNGVDPNNPSYKRTATASEKQSRYEFSGVFQRLSDIIEDNITTYRDSNDKKGILLEKAGIDGDLSFTENLMNEELERYDDRIDIMLQRLQKKEENYYLKFSKMEAMLNKMNSQSSWLSSQFGGGQ